MKLSLSWKVNAIIMIVVTLVFLGAGGYEISKTWQQLVHDLEDTSTAIIKRLTITLVDPMWGFNDNNILTYMQGEMQDEHVLAIEVKRPVGQKKYFLLIRDEAWQVVSGDETQGEIMGFIVKENDIIRWGETLGTVKVYMTDRFINETYQTEVVTLLLRTLALLLFIVLTLFLLIERVVVRPVRTLTHQAQVIAGGNLDESIVAERSDELGILATSFEIMRHSIKDKIMALHDEIMERQRAENMVHELNEELEQRVIARTQRLEVVASLSEQLNALLDFNQLLVVLVNQIKINLNYYQVHIYLLDPDLQYLVIAEGTGEVGREMKQQEHRIALTEPASLVAQAARQGQIISVANVQEAANWLANPLLPDTYAEMAVPIIREGQVVGVLDVQSDKIGGLDEGDANLLRSLAGQVAVAINNAHLYSLAQQEINDRRKAEAALQQANDDLAKVNADKDKFFSIVAHDLKSPFTPMLGNAQTLVNLADSLPRPQIKKLSETLLLSAQNTLSLLENLLHWARLQMGRMEYQPKPLNLREMLQQTVNLLTGTAESKGITLISLLQAEVMVQADEHMLATIIRNLTNNALKFTPSGGRVTLSAKELGIRNKELTTPNSQLLIPNYVEVWVADNGVGIPPENLVKLFKTGQHVSTMGTAEEKGTGLGLVMCQEMVQRHGGKIWVESEWGQGTTFKFTMPAAGALPEGDWLMAVVEEETVAVETQRYAVPSRERLAELHLLAVSGSLMKVEEWLQVESPQYQPFCEQVSQLVDMFDWAGVVELVEQYL